MAGIFHWLLLLALLHVLLRDWRKALPISLLAWIPWGPHFVGIMRGALGELSVGTILLSVLLLQPKPLKEIPGLGPAAGLVVCGGVLVYGDFLALLPTVSLQLYEAGFSSRWLPVGIAILGSWAIIRAWWWPAVWAGLVLLVWNLEWFASRNIWDHLFDVPLWILSAIYLCRRACSKRS